MVARFLVTTALEDTWPDDDVPILFLGEWCRIYSRKSAWGKRNAVVATYHWDDRQKLCRDYLYLQALHEDLLEELVDQLNAIHEVDHSIRYWRIVVGPWLGYFVQMLFDRWVMLCRVVDEHDISGVRVLQNPEDWLVPNGMDEFMRMLECDPWNESIYGQIVDWMRIPCKKITPTSGACELPIRANAVSLASRIKRKLARVYTSFSSSLCRDTEYFFISSYLGLKQDLHLQLKLRQLPKLWRPVALPVSSLDRASRHWKISKIGNVDEFRALVSELIPRQIPKAYLEGYSELVTLTEKLPWPKNPRAIFTSNSFNSDDVFKVWAAGKVESGTPLIIGQHGGNYGMGLWNFLEDHQIAISDRFLTWGWGRANQNKIIPVGNFKGFGEKHAGDKDGIALIVEMGLPRYSYHMYCVPVAAGQWLDYFEEQCRFVHSLSAELREQCLVRLYSHDYSLCQRQRWLNQFPAIKLDEGAKSMSALLDKTKLYIGTYNATNYLESLSLNIPTIIFWNPEHWELRDDAHSYFEKLKSVGIFHETPESAAQQMESVWEDVSGWWQSDEVQLAREVFCEKYASTPEKPLEEMKKLFLSIANAKI